MKYCTKCGNPLGDEKICTKCGTKVEEAITNSTSIKSAYPSTVMVIGILLIVAGVLGFFGSMFAYGDIGLSFGLIAIVSILAGIGFISQARASKKK